MNHVELIPFMKGITFLNYGVILVFIYLFYKNYIQISTTASTKQLMKNILKTRKTVQYYVWYNLGMAVISLIIGYIIALAFNPETKCFNEPNYQIVVKLWQLHVGVFLLTTVAFFGIFWLFYRLLYGILLRRLQANYKELKKIDL